jgi:hypothetical protein
MMEAARASETWGDIQLRTWQYIPKDSELHIRRQLEISQCLFYCSYAQQSCLRAIDSFKCQKSLPDDGLLA